MRIVADPTIDGQAFDGYLELYGNVDRPARLASQLRSPIRTPALRSPNSPRSIAAAKEKDRYIAEAPLPIGLLPPGDYVARASVTAGGCDAAARASVHARQSGSRK